MKKVSTVLQEIFDDPTNFFNQRSSEIGEHRISGYLIKKLTEEGYKRIGEVKTSVWSSKVEECSKNIPTFKEIQTSILDSVNEKPIKNTTKLKNCFIYQPFGSQKYPDFIIFMDKYILPLEIKTISNDKVMSPKFNDRPPMLSGVYLSIHYGLKKIMIFKGSEYSSKKSHEYRDMMINKFQEVREKVNMELEKENDLVRFSQRPISSFVKGTKFFKREDLEAMSKRALLYIEKKY